MSNRSVKLGESHKRHFAKVFGSIFGVKLEPADIPALGTVFTLAPTECFDWLNDNCAGLWLIADNYRDLGGDRIWFELEEDAAMFALAWAHLSAERKT